jgi:ATP-binding cassette subfamily B protein RaxB
MRVKRPQQAWFNMSGRRRLPVVRQATATECGLACIAMVSQYFSVATDLAWLRRRYGASLKGATLANISQCCRDLGMSTRAIRCGFDELDKLQKPCVLHWRFNHFVVLKSVSKNAIVIHDPARGVIVESTATAREAFTGIVLEVSSAARIQRVAGPLQLRLSSLISNEPGIRSKFLAGLVLAMICELLLLTSPFYLQSVIDQVLGKSDEMLLNVLLLLFLTLLLFHVAANVMRQLTFLFLGHVTVFDITSRVLNKLLNLPVSFFRSRELGDVQHRVQSLSRIQNFIVQGVPALVLDALFLILITVVMLLYQASLTLLMFSALFVWCGWRVLILAPSLRLSSDIAQTESAVQTHFLETLRTVQSIKLANGEAQRESEWRNLFADATNTRVRLGNLQIADSAVRQTVFQGARIVAIYWLAREGLQNHMSIGAISAYVAYLGMFTTRCSGIVDRIMEFKLLEVPLNRLSDIVFSDAEPAVPEVIEVGVDDVELKNLSFAYSRDEPAILQNCDAHFEESGLTVIAGPSGSGKSTLLQIIAGNEIYTEGEVLFNGRSARNLSLKSLRSQMAVVFQGDSLLKGSVAENIALFSPDIDMSRTREAAAKACIASDIEALPMAYETRIGDLGSSLSRGQVQRILLARAYYRRPVLLLLDEATSGLDSDLERQVIASLAEIPATKIVVSHSDLMLQAADKVLWLVEGKLLLSRLG